MDEVKLRTLQSISQVLAGSFTLFDYPERRLNIHEVGKEPLYVSFVLLPLHQSVIEGSAKKVETNVGLTTFWRPQK